jgi:signal peptide peptidase SppA
MRDQHLFRLVYEQPWLICEDKLQEIIALVYTHARGDHGDPTAYAGDPERRAAARDAFASGPPTIGLLPIHGTIADRGSGVTRASGLVTSERLRQDFQALVADPGIDAILLDIDSPGGMAAGIPELTDTIYRARGTKPITALAFNFAASAAYWIASAADEIVVTPSGEVGSIGVVVVHSDYSKAFSDRGVTNTIIRSTPRKVEANPLEPLSEEAAGSLQEKVNEIHADFTQAVARGRGLPIADVRRFADGRTYRAREALRLGMVDRIGTVDSTVRKLARRSRGMNARVDATLLTRRRRWSIPS